MAQVKKKDKVARAAELFALLGDVTRLRMLVAITKVPRGLYVHQLAERALVSHSAISHQLARCAALGVLEAKREGQLVRYRFSRTPVARTVRALIKKTYA